jgi:SAM-dependent methyltransferase
MYGRQIHVGVTPARSSEVDLEALAHRDRWFYDHFVWAPKILTEFLARVIELEPSVVLDFGCGQGLMAKGVARFTRQVHGVDIIPGFENVEERFQKIFGVPDLFPPVKLQQVQPDIPLPYDNGSFDAVYSWSVFEHVDDVPFALSEIHRVIRPGGAFFLQISPLYYSSQGGHLWNILDEPWIHLRLSREELLERVRHANLGRIPKEKQHDAFQGESAEVYRAGVIACHDTLNRITLGQLVSHVQAAGFTIAEQLTMRDGPKDVPADLLKLYPEEDMRTDQVVLLLTR